MELSHSPYFSSNPGLSCYSSKGLNCIGLVFNGAKRDAKVVKMISKRIKLELKEEKRKAEEYRRMAMRLPQSSAESKKRDRWSFTYFI